MPWYGKSMVYLYENVHLINTEIGDIAAADSCAKSSERQKQKELGKK